MLSKPIVLTWSLIAKYDPKGLALQACQCPRAKIRSGIWKIDERAHCDCNGKHPLVKRIREYGISRITQEKISNILGGLSWSLAFTHHPDDVHRNLQLEDSLSSKKQQIKYL
jgi:hypothetical protein